MARYIDADKKIEEMNMYIESITRLIENRPYDEEAKLMLREFKYCLEELINTPTVEAEEVKHGKWIVIKGEKEKYGTLTCSCCLYTYRRLHPKNYCPHCGAKMNGGSE